MTAKTDEQSAADLAVEVLRISKAQTQSTAERAAFHMAGPTLAQALLLAQEKIAWLKPHVDGLAKVADGHREGEARAITEMKNLRQQLARASALVKQEYERGWKECRDGVLMTQSTYHVSTPSWMAIMVVLEDLAKLEKLPHDPPPDVTAPPLEAPAWSNCPKCNTGKLVPSTIAYAGRTRDPNVLVCNNHGCANEIHASGGSPAAPDVGTP